MTSISCKVVLGQRDEVFVAGEDAAAESCYKVGFEVGSWLFNGKRRFQMHFVFYFSPGQNVAYNFFLGYCYGKESLKLAKLLPKNPDVDGVQRIDLVIRSTPLVGEICERAAELQVMFQPLDLNYALNHPDFQF